MNRTHLGHFHKFLLLPLAVVLLFSTGFASAVDNLRGSPDILLDTYHRNTARLSRSAFGFPIFLDSLERNNRVHVDVYGILAFSFIDVVNMLKVPANWCDIVSLHPNIKSCTYRELSGSWLLTFYIGRKIYQPPEDTHPVVYTYRKIEEQNGYLDIIVSADAGPFGTKDHRMRVEAVPLDGGKTFIHVSYAHSDSVALRLAEKVYFATLGRGKVGFTVTGTDGKGKPVYIGGPRGAIERNAVRYYCAIQSFMNTSRYPENSRFTMRSSEWYDLTTRYTKQLLDLDKKDYLMFKATEHKNQETLQGRILTVLQDKGLETDPSKQRRKRIGNR